MIKKWSKLESKPIADYRIFKLRQDTSQSPRTGQAHTFFVLESLDWINVIPLTAEGKVVFIHQYRHGTESVSLEIPGGIVDQDESPAEASRRELLEETGYTAEQIIPTGVITPNPAFLNNRCHTFLALGARYVRPPQFDGAEDIAVEEIALEAVPTLITSGHINHALVIAAFYNFEQYRRQQPDWQTSHPTS
jgi:ADP-ribose pyrophosphatase